MAQTSEDLNTPQQQVSAPKLKETRPPASDPSQEITLPAGTKLPLALKHAITTKTAHDGDAVYAETTFPVVVNNQIIIPAGAYVQGSITNIKRPGRVKGRAELLVHFNTLIFPNGYTVLLPGAVDNVPGLDTGKMKPNDKEGTIQGDSNKGKDAATIAKDAGYGGLGGIGVGAANGRPLTGGAIGGAAGGLVGLATVLFTRGPELRLDAGSTVETALERPISVDMSRVKAKP
ncbi:MAG TPA: hypothetical protein VGL89_07160 [Candidatus Koribacter sp.]